MPSRPAFPSSPQEIAELEAIAALGWPAPDTARLGGWLLRAAEGWTGRANSVLPLGDSGRSLDDALRLVRQWYAERGLSPRFQVPLPLCESLDVALASRGWTAGDPVLVRIASVTDVLESAAVGSAPLAIRLETRPTPEWLAAYHYRGLSQLPPVAVRVMTAAADPVFASVVIDNAVVAVARAVVDRGWCGITAVEVQPDLRGRGVGRRLLRGVVSWAAARGATSVYLQVSAGNQPANALYDRLGFVTSHRYHYRTLT